MGREGRSGRGGGLSGREVKEKGGGEQRGREEGGGEEGITKAEGRGGEGLDSELKREWLGLGV